MCKRPLKAFDLGLKENGKKNLLVRPYEVSFIEKCNDKWLSRYGDVPLYPSEYWTDKFIEIPCGQCIECRLNRSRQWADRCVLEQQYHEQSLFLTLTYDDEHLPKNQMVNLDSGEIVDVATLQKADMSKFMKALRQEYAKNHDNELRFFGCGEYGSETFRPHFHIIVFGLLLDDLKFHHKNFQGDDFFTSETINKCWRHRGYVLISDVTWQCCAYTARYILKKHLGKDSDWYEKNGIEPEFVNMSRRPGIAKQYYDDHPDIFEHDFISIPTHQGGKDVFPPKYFEKLYELDYPSDAAKRKEKKREFMEEKKMQKLLKTDQSYLDLLATEEYILTKKVNSLPRKEI